MSDLTVFTNNPSTTAASTSGTTSPASGTTESWSVSSSSGFPAASNAAAPLSVFHIADPALPAELIRVTNISGTTWSVTRGDEGTTPVAHATGATYFQVVSAGDLSGMKQATGALTSPVTYAGSGTESLIAEYQPFTGEISAGTTFELVAAGSIKITGTPTIQWNLRWGWVSSGTPGTSILSLTSGTSCASLTSASMTVACAFDLTGTVTFISSTSAIANLNFWFATNATTGQGTGVTASATAVTGLTAPPGGGPLALTAKWSTTSAANSLVVPGPLIYRAA
jgi:hypothetical protein